MLVLLLSLTGAELLSDKQSIALQIGSDVALAKAHTVSEAVLIGQDSEALELNGTRFKTHRYPSALTNDVTEQDE